MSLIFPSLFCSILDYSLAGQSRIMNAKQRAVVGADLKQAVYAANVYDFDAQGKPFRDDKLFDGRWSDDPNDPRERAPLFFVNTKGSSAKSLDSKAMLKIFRIQAYRSTMTMIERSESNS